MKTDKILHLLFGFIIAWRLIDINIHWMLSIVIVIIFAVGKELYDYKAYGLFDWKDVIATISGGIILLLTQLMN